ncbi:MAG: CopD family protein [Rhodocyclaceae bacterium]|nr:CopD family protein [Rhodocyclaceae bacterium]
MRSVLLFLHYAGAIIWIGGMFFAHFCLRPAALEHLTPEHRLPLWQGVLSHFLPLAGLGVSMLVISGVMLLASVGLDAAPIGWQVMAAVGALMAALYCLVAFVFFPAFSLQCIHSDWVKAAAALDRIRRLVLTNLALSLVVLTAATASG